MKSKPRLKRWIMAALLAAFTTALLGYGASRAASVAQAVCLLAFLGIWLLWAWDWDNVRKAYGGVALISAFFALAIAQGMAADSVNGFLKRTHLSVVWIEVGFFIVLFMAIGLFKEFTARSRDRWITLTGPRQIDGDSKHG